MKKKLLGIILGAFCGLALTSCDIGFLLPDNGNNNGGSETGGNTEVKKEFKLYRRDTSEVINDNDTLSIEAYNDFFFTAKYDNTDLQIKSITSSDETVVFPHSRSIYPRKEGTATIIVTCETSAGELYKTTFTINSCYNNELSKIYVANGKDGISVDSNYNVKITGKVIAKYKNDVLKTINNDSNLTTKVENGTDSNTKKVTLTYTKDGITQSVSYDVNTNNNNNSISKTTLKQSFKDYWDTGYYKSSSGDTVPSSGDVKVLAIPVWFTDSSSFINDAAVDYNGKSQKQQIIEDWNESLFGETKRKDEYSLKTYYYDESFGKLNIDGKVSDWYNSAASSSTNYYTDRNTRTNVMIDAYNWYKNTNPSDTTEYDVVTFLYGSNHYGEESNAYTAFRTNINDNSCPDLNNVIWCGALTQYGIDDDTNSFNQGDLSDLCNNDALVPSVLVHEFAHCMGAIDLYSDTRASDQATTKGPAGYYGMQLDHTGGHDPYSMMGFGYVDPYVVSADKDYGTNSIEITINDMISSGDAIILTNSWNEYDSPFDEYLVLELYSETGVNRFDSYNNGKCGIRLYHVDSRLLHVYQSKWGSNIGPGNIIPFSNTRGRTYYPTSFDNYRIFNSSYGNYDLVHMIRKNSQDSKGNVIEYNSSYGGKEDDWFLTGDTFAMSNYANQFINYGILDNGNTLGLSFTVNSITKNDNGTATAKITITKE